MLECFFFVHPSDAYKRPYDFISNITNIVQEKGTFKQLFIYYFVEVNQTVILYALFVKK